MKARISSYATKWTGVEIEVDGKRIVQVTPEPVNRDEWLKNLPTAPGENGPFSLTDDPERWLTTMSRANYTRFSVKIVD